MSMRPLPDSALVSGWFGAGLPESARARLADLAVMEAHPAGATVVREGDPVDALGIVADGRLAIRLSVPGREVMTVLTVEPGDCIGWSALVPPYRATSTIVALEATNVVAFPGPTLRTAMEEDPTLAAAILRAVLDAVVRRLAATRTQLLDLFAAASPDPW